MVRQAGGLTPGPAGGMPPQQPPGAMPGGPPPPRPPDPPSPKIQCPYCEFSFIVGEIEVASCPNCGKDVETGFEAPESGA